MDKFYHIDNWSVGLVPVVCIRTRYVLLTDLSPSLVPAVWVLKMTHEMRGKKKKISQTIDRYNNVFVQASSSDDAPGKLSSKLINRGHPPQ